MPRAEKQFSEISHCVLKCINIDKCNDKKTQCFWRPFPPLVNPGENSWPYHRNPGMSGHFGTGEVSMDVPLKDSKVPPACGISTSRGLPGQPHSHTWRDLLIGIIYPSHFLSSKTGRLHWLSDSHRRVLFKCSGINLSDWCELC